MLCSRHYNLQVMHRGLSQKIAVAYFGTMALSVSATLSPGKLVSEAPRLSRPVSTPSHAGRDTQTMLSCYRMPGANHCGHLHMH